MGVRTGRGAPIIHGGAAELTSGPEDRIGRTRGRVGCISGRKGDEEQLEK
jgi:hypothetical protein